MWPDKNVAIAQLQLRLFTASLRMRPAGAAGVHEDLSRRAHCQSTVLNRALTEMRKPNLASSAITDQCLSKWEKNGASNMQARINTLHHWENGDK